MKLLLNNLVLFLILTALLGTSAVAGDVEEFNPVDIIDGFYSKAETKVLPKDVNIIAEKLLRELVSSPAEMPRKKLEISREIVDLLIPANIASADKKHAQPQTVTRRKLWETTIALSTDFDKKEDSTLETLISKIKALKFENMAQQTAPEEQSEDTKAESVEKENQEQIISEPLEDEPLSVESENNIADAGELTDEILKKIESGIADIEAPYQLAEMLYCSQRFYYSSLCYKQALKLGRFEEQPEEKAWILFQIGNCLKSNNPSEAMGYYTRVITEHPTSAWATAAKQYNGLLNWQSQDRPYELIKEQQANLQKESDDE